MNIEIILVDDGSTDSCKEICDSYANKDKRIVVIHKENGGLSDARNAGIEILTEKYVTFVDSDDWVEPTMLNCCDPFGERTTDVLRWMNMLQHLSAFERHKYRYEKM